MVPEGSPYRTLQDLIDALKRAPHSVSWGGGSAGGTDDSLLARLLAEAVGVAPSLVNYVAFSGGGEALAAVLGGQVTAGVSGYGEFAQSIAAGQLRPLATSAPAANPVSTRPPCVKRACRWTWPTGAGWSRRPASAPPSRPR